METLMLLPLLSLLLSLCYYVTMKHPFKPPTESHAHKKKQQLPPGPPPLVTLAMLPFISLSHSSDLRRLVVDLRRRYGPIVTVRADLSSPTIIVADRRLIREALVEKGAAFAARPRRGIEPGPVPIIGAISTATYGQKWRLLRQSLASGIFHPSSLRSLASHRRWALGILREKLESQAESREGVVEVRDALECAVLGLVGFMCYGEKLAEPLIHDVKAAHTQLMSIYNELSFAFLPKLADFFFGSRSKALWGIRRRHEEVFIPLLRARRELKQQQQRVHVQQGSCFRCHVDSLLELRLPEENGRALDDGEIVTICSELLSAGAEQVSTTVEWIIAHLVRAPCMQQRLLEEIQRVMAEDGGAPELKEESIERMEYLHAVVLEGLRRHPPSHLLLPHAVTKEVSLGGYLIPKDASVLFPVEEMGSDESLWPEPLEFLPERFLAGGEGEGVDLTGTRELKMMPFGLGRRTCPASAGVSVPLLKYLVANMVKEFKWEKVEGEGINMLGKLGLAVTMDAPLHVRLSPRSDICLISDVR